MIDPRELRIGNLIYAGASKIIVRVLNITENSINAQHKRDLQNETWTHTGFLPECSYPIVLDEEILKKCGFNLTKNIDEEQADFFYINKISEYITQKNLTFHFHYPSLFECPIEINSLHQFQNLYYALYDEEVKHFF